jgi:hypothetical protein
MEVYAKPRQRGKTTDLIKLAAEEFLYIVCIDRTEVRRVADEAREMGLDIPFPLTWHEFASGLYHGHGIQGFVIDNLDLCIQQVTPAPIRAVSLTVPEPVAGGTTPPGTAAP